MARALIAVPDSTVIHGHAPWATTRRRSIVREVTEAVLAAEGTEYSPAEAWRVWVIIDEVANGFWGMAGSLFHFEDLVSFIAPDQVKTPVGERLRQAADAALAEEPATLSTS
jgi:phenylpyruvate tautomerase PptA (4-oxalocrotonate tautomerase family)